jgi:hypothetical protein
MSEQKYVTIVHVIGTDSEAGKSYQFLSSRSVLEVVETLANEAGLKKFIVTADGVAVDPKSAGKQTIGELVGDKDSVEIATRRRATAA